MQCHSHGLDVRPVASPGDAAACEGVPGGEGARCQEDVPQFEPNEISAQAGLPPFLVLLGADAPATAAALVPPGAAVRARARQTHALRPSGRADVDRRREERRPHLREERQEDQAGSPHQEDLAGAPPYR